MDRTPMAKAKTKPKTNRKAELLATPVEHIDITKIDAIVATGASIVDMDFFEALGFKHYQGSQFVDDKDLRDLYIDRIYDTYIDEEELQHCDKTIGEIADGLKPGPYSSRAFIKEMGAWLKTK